VHTKLERASDSVRRECAEIRAEYLRVLNMQGFAWCDEGMQSVEGNEAYHLDSGLTESCRYSRAADGGSPGRAVYTVTGQTFTLADGPSFLPTEGD